MLPQAKTRRRHWNLFLERPKTSFAGLPPHRKSTPVRDTRTPLPLQGAVPVLAQAEMRSYGIGILEQSPEKKADHKKPAE
jgi:hypothetical protein